MKKYVAIIDKKEYTLEGIQKEIQKRGEALVVKISEINQEKANETTRSYIPEIRSLISDVVANHPTVISRLTVLCNLRRMIADTLGYEHEASSYLLKWWVENDLISE